MPKNLSEKTVGALGSVSGVTSILGSWQICHNICLSLIAVLGAIGIAVAGLPLLFLTKIALPAWILAVALFFVTLVFYFKKKCIPQYMLVVNLGLLVAGTPFQSLKDYQVFFWGIGGGIIVVGAVLFMNKKIKLNRNVIVLVVAALILLAWVSAILFFTLTDKKADISNNAGSSKNEGFRSIVIGDTGQGNVEIGLQPIEVKPGMVKVKISANTHSVDLGQFDLKKIVVLKYGSKELKPVEASALSGHHASGFIVFQPTGELKSFTIILKGIPAIDQRKYEW
ncbi:MAG TPA: hypothetical protein VJB90_01265 [Candidatus Nanoarchaeia archaeon]|nr:hypothetical protein [Candidatus Nanoarchaeia archaeon]